MSEFAGFALNSVVALVRSALELVDRSQFEAAAFERADAISNLFTFSFVNPRLVGLAELPSTGGSRAFDDARDEMFGLLVREYASLASVEVPGTGQMEDPLSVCGQTFSRAIVLLSAKAARSTRPGESE